MTIREYKKADLLAALEKDPAALSKTDIRLTYGGYRALRLYRRAHKAWTGGRFLYAKILSARARKKHGIDIHPAAKIGTGVFIDHGVGVVIGETAEIGNNVTIYQGATLGGTGKDTGKRHPTVGDGVVISAGAKILGPIIIGEGSKIGAGSVVLKDVPPHSTVVGVPGHIVRIYGKKYQDFDQRLPDPVLEEFERLNKRLGTVEDKLEISACKYSISNSEED